MRTWQVEWLAVGLLLVASMAHADPKERVSTPDLEFLEFLGSWEGESEESLDHMMDDVPLWDRLEGDESDRRDRLGGREVGNGIGKEPWSQPLGESGAPVTKEEAGQTWYDRD